jgi:hypothetical protein
LGLEALQHLLEHVRPCGSVLSGSSTYHNYCGQYLDSHDHPFSCGIFHLQAFKHYTPGDSELAGNGGRLF